MIQRNYSGIPLSNLANGIAHGPYPEDPENLMPDYLANREYLKLSPDITEEQFIKDIQSEIQYDQHAEAVEDALEEDIITPQHALYMLEKVLRPWFIGRRDQ